MKKSSRISKRWFYEPDVIELASKIIPRYRVEDIIASMRDFMMSVGECRVVPTFGFQESYYVYSEEFVGLAVIKFSAAAKKIQQRSSHRDFVPVAQFASKYHTTHTQVKTVCRQACGPDATLFLKQIDGQWCFHRNLSSQLHAQLVPLADDQWIHTGRWKMKKPNLAEIENRYAHLN
jgi:hypothetical protein